jgi:hypothetical protein
LPFDRQSHSTGVTPSQSLLPFTTKLPEGTAIPVRLRSTISSATAHAGDVFRVAIDDPVVVNGQTLVAAGTTAVGRVLEAKASTGSLEPGYLRIVLVSLEIGDRTVMIETSSIFEKGGPRDAASSASTAQKDVVLGADRRLSFRLAQTVDLKPSSNSPR